MTYNTSKIQPPYANRAKNQFIKTKSIVKPKKIWQRCHITKVQF